MNYIIKILLIVCGLRLLVISVYAESIESLTKLSADGDRKAQYKLCNAYYEGIDVAVSYEQALIFCKKSAINGSVKAQYKLAEMYEKGIGTKQNYSKAFYWYKKLNKVKKLDDMNIKYKIGDMYYYGLGVEQNYQKAISYFRVAAVKGHLKSIKKLALMSFKGVGMSKDYTKSYVWFVVMNRLSYNPHVSGIVNKLEYLLTPIQISKGYDVADDILAKIQNPNQK